MTGNVSKNKRDNKNIWKSNPKNDSNSMIEETKNKENGNDNIDS